MVAVATVISGCALFISLDDITEDRPGDGGAGSTVAPDASNGTPDASIGTADASIGTADASIDRAAMDTGIGMTRADAGGGMAEASLPGDAGRTDAGTCTNPTYPVSCPALGSPADGGVPANCWTAATDCSTLKNCAGAYHACTSDHRFDCATNSCVLTCTDPMYPVMCPAVGSVPDGGTPADCWTAGVDCSTVKNCSGISNACLSNYVFDCATNQCRLPPRDGGSDADAAPPVTCTGGQTACNRRCVDLQTDVSNCGACSVGCEGGNRCFAGHCCSAPAAGGNCNLPACGCAAGQVCYPDTPATGLTCLASDGVQQGGACGGNGDVCAAGLGCFGGVCKPYCSSDGDCPSVDGARLCDTTTWSAGGEIPGVLVCRRVCDPVTPQTPRAPLLACPPGRGCLVDTTGASNCFVQPGTATTGAACDTSADCASGYYCTVSSTCNKHCFASTDCPPGLTCFSFNPPNFAGTREVGYCF